MARDKRPYAQIDVGWHMNPKWFQVERSLRDAMPDAMPDALLHALQDAKQLHITSILYSAQARWDGMFPVAAVKSFARSTYEEAVTALFEVGMWINHPGGMAEIRHFLKHQPSSSDLEDASERAKKAANARWENAERNASGNAERNASGNAEKRREEKSINTRPTDENANAFSRPDVKEIFDYFTNSLKKLGVTRLPGKNKTNATAIRRLLDTDKRTVTQIKAAIDFAHNDPFWKANILSLSKLREQYEQLRLKAQQQNSSPQQKQNDAAHDRWALARANAAKQRNGGDAA